jgi:hypothetical protein
MPGPAVDPRRRQQRAAREPHERGEVARDGQDRGDGRPAVARERHRLGVGAEEAQ